MDRTIQFYQVNLSHRLGHRCRFYPSCSHYARTCLAQYPSGRAVKKIIFRLSRCQPWNQGGFDYP